MSATTQIYRLPQVKAVTGLSRSSIYKFQSLGLFPQSLRLGPRCIGWNSCQIEKWVETRQRGGGK
jgi:prophage regulatory protein